jgi:cold-inducible RNA-binding protein
MSNKLFVGNLSWNANENDLQSVFEPHGTIEEVKIVVDRDTNRSRGFGFVKFASDEEAQSAIKHLHDTEFMGRNLKVSVAENNRGGERRSGGRSEGYRNQRSY